MKRWQNPNLLDSEVFVSNWGLHTHTRSLTVRPPEKLPGPNRRGIVFQPPFFQGGCCWTSRVYQQFCILTPGDVFFANFILAATTSCGRNPDFCYSPKILPIKKKTCLKLSGRLAVFPYIEVTPIFCSANWYSQRFWFLGWDFPTPKMPVGSSWVVNGLLGGWTQISPQMVAWIGSESCCHAL